MYILKIQEKIFREDKMKVCQNCKQFNTDDSVTCKLCGYEFKETDKPQVKKDPSKAKEKNKILALILSLIIPGLGNYYQEFKQRFVVEFIIGLVLIGIYFIIGEYGLVLYILWEALVLIDTYQCNIVITEGREIPTFFKMKLDQ